MLTKLDNVTFKSDEGYTFRELTHGRGYRCEYAEGERRLLVYCEIGDSGTVVDFPESPKWEPPFENELIATDKVNQIVHRIKDVYEFWGGHAEVFLTKPNRIHKKNEMTVEDPDEFELLKLSNEVYVYRTGGKSIIIKATFAPDPQGGPIIPWVSNQDISRWSPPHDKESISEPQQALIHFNLQRGLRLFGFQSVVIELVNGKKISMS